VYRKLAATGIIIPNDSCHLPEQKLAAIRYLVNRLSTYTINVTNKRQQYDTIKQILHNNKYNVKILNRINSKTDTKTDNDAKTKTKNGLNLHKLDGKQNSSLSYLKNSDLKMSFKADNTIGKLLTHNKKTNFNKYNKCGVYQLACQDCNTKYIGQSDRPFHTRFQEHL
jgi:hypothetical protein